MDLAIKVIDPYGPNQQLPVCHAPVAGSYDTIYDTPNSNAMMAFVPPEKRGPSNLQSATVMPTLAAW